MSRLKDIGDSAKQAGKKLLIPYLVAGDPDLETSLRLMHALVEAGADAIELGIPFSDPSSDGPVIQLAGERSLRQGTGLIDVLKLVSEFRKSDTQTAIVLMGYLNPLERMGYQKFILAAAEADVDGVLVVDMPTSESAPLSQGLRSHDIDTIYLIAPTTSESRTKSIAENTSGYLYYVSLKGVTGAAISDTESIKSNIDKLRSYTDIPVIVGFGIKGPEDARRMADIADGVIIGSALVERIAKLDKGETDRGVIADAVSVISQARRAIDS